MWEIEREKKVTRHTLRWITSFLKPWIVFKSSGLLVAGSGEVASGDGFVLGLWWNQGSVFNYLRDLDAGDVLTFSSDFWPSELYRLASRRLTALTRLPPNLPSLPNSSWSEPKSGTGKDPLMLWRGLLFAPKARRNTEARLASKLPPFPWGRSPSVSSVDRMDRSACPLGAVGKEILISDENTAGSNRWRSSGIREPN
jgi:hypothetical protein